MYRAVSKLIINSVLLVTFEVTRWRARGVPGLKRQLLINENELRDDLIVRTFYGSGAFWGEDVYRPSLTSASRVEPSSRMALCGGFIVPASGRNYFYGGKMFYFLELVAILRICFGNRRHNRYKKNAITNYFMLSLLWANKICPNMIDFQVAALNGLDKIFKSQFFVIKI